MKVYTESGSVYEIDQGFWSRNNEPPVKYWSLKTIPDPGEVTYSEVLRRLKDRPAVDKPVVGERMCLLSPEQWQLSSKVERIEE